MAVRMNSVAVALLLGALGLLVGDARRSCSATPLSDRTLASILGSNLKTKGMGGYTCADFAASTNKNWVTAATCGGYANAQATGQVCVSCDVSNSSIQTNGMGNNIMPAGPNANCAVDSNGNPSVLSSVGTCQPNMALPTAGCQGQTNPNMGACPAGNYGMWKTQPVGNN